MTQVSFGSTFFGVQYHSRDEEGTSIDKRIRVAVRNKYIARHIFREATEQQVYFYQATVLPEVRNHVDNHSRRFRKFCKSVLFGREHDREREYYFDIIRTKHEVYSHVWQLLHQVQGGEGEGRGERVRGERGEDGDETGTESTDTAHATFTM